jgi:hypothetical protein
MLEILGRFICRGGAGDDKEGTEMMLRTAIRILVEMSVAQAPKLLKMGVDKNSPERTEDQDGKL